MSTATASRHDQLAMLRTLADELPIFRRLDVAKSVTDHGKFPSLEVEVTYRLRDGQGQWDHTDHIEITVDRMTSVEEADAIFDVRSGFAEIPSGLLGFHDVMDAFGTLWRRSEEE